MHGEREAEIKRIRALFAGVVSRPDAQIDLAHGTLLIAAEEYPQLDIAEYLRRLDHMAEQVRERVCLELAPEKVIEVINHTLFTEMGFYGNADDYYDPKNSFLNEVIDRRKGIPITLSIIYLEVGWRLDLPLSGVGLPGHFIVKYQPRDREILIDPFHRGTLLSEEDCRRTVERIYSGQMPFHRDRLASASKRLIFARVLKNLKAIYVQRRNFARALGVVERLLLIDLDSPTELRDRGLIYGQMQHFPEAIADLRRYLETAPEAEDRESIAERLRQLQMRHAARN
jgi:regulator of sirC expression with transglutaminase-like and TPR domain